MARTTRLMNPKAPKREPVSPLDWERLLRKAIERAQKTKDSRLVMLQTALSQKRGRNVLKKLGIICDADLTREFPEP
jgi:hypothetical protein